MASVNKQIRTFAQEERVLSYLDHRNIVWNKGVSYLHDTKSPVLIMELLWKSLHEFLDAKPKLPTQETLHLLHDVAKGLKYLHDNNIVSQERISF